MVQYGQYCYVKQRISMKNPYRSMVRYSNNDADKYETENGLTFTEYCVCRVGVQYIIQTILFPVGHTNTTLHNADIRTSSNRKRTSCLCYYLASPELRQFVILGEMTEYVRARYA